MDEQKQEITLAIAKRIKYYRHLRNYSQETLALQANLNPAYYGQVERGLKCPTVDSLYKISKALDVSLSELLRIDSPPLTFTDNNYQCQQIQELFSRVPADKRERFIKVMEDVIRLLSES